MKQTVHSLTLDQATSTKTRSRKTTYILLFEIIIRSYIKTLATPTKNCTCQERMEIIYQSYLLWKVIVNDFESTENICIAN